MRKTTVICWLALSAGAVLFGVHGASAQGTPDAREACTPDAMRVCSEFIPDEEKVKRCMIRRHSQLSAECRRAMAGSHGRYRHGTHRHRHYRHRH